MRFAFLAAAAFGLSAALIAIVRPVLGPEPPPEPVHGLHAFGEPVRTQRESVVSELVQRFSARPSPSRNDGPRRAE
jgi:hypothetical protein